MADTCVFDKESAEFISVLMFVAKSIDQVRRSADLPIEEAMIVALEAQRNVLSLVDDFYPEAGQMEQQVIAFADRMGFDVRQRYFSVQSNATH